MNIIEHEGTLVVDSRLIAERLGIKHKNLLETVYKYQSQIEQRFGQLRFETEAVRNRAGAVNEVKFSLLTEAQATALMTFSRNTEQVVECKLELVDSFEKAKQAVVQLVAPKVPQSYLEALKALVAVEEEKQRLEAEKALLEEENHALAEAVDELFDYSSIVRIAKFNRVSETLFSWRKLKAVSQKMGVEVKRVPCPRFEFKNLYSHDVWRICYPEHKLPETTTLVIAR